MFLAETTLDAACWFFGRVNSTIECLRGELTILSRTAIAIYQQGLARFRIKGVPSTLLITTGAAGMSYEEAAEIAHCAVGAIKSRLNRARVRLTTLLGVEGAEAFGPDRAIGV